LATLNKTRREIKPQNAEILAIVLDTHIATRKKKQDHNLEMHDNADNKMKSLSHYRRGKVG
jgi:hypothetical protein